MEKQQMPSIPQVPGMAPPQPVSGYGNEGLRPPQPPSSDWTSPQPPSMYGTTGLNQYQQQTLPVYGAQPNQSQALTLDGDIPVAVVLDGNGAPLQQEMYAQQSSNYQTQHSMGFGHALQASDRVVVRQKYQGVEAALQAIGLGCCEQANEYFVYDFQTGNEILHVTESSETCMRAFCHPHHRLSLNFVDTRYGVSPGTSMMKTHHPFKCGCCAVHDICKHEVYLEQPDGFKFQQLRTPFLGGCTTPTLEVMDRKGTVEGTVVGPSCCLGGLVEMCTDSTFVYRQGKSSDGPPLGSIVKTAPKDLKGRLMQVAGDSDTYTVNFPINSTPEQKASFLATAILLDYLYFEGGPPIQCSPIEQTCRTNVCSCYCAGCVCPFTIECGGNNHSE